MTQTRGLRAALDAMHEQLWDDERGMVRLYGLHLVRETALGAFLDLENGQVERAQRALHHVLQHQYSLDADPRWAGTFKTHAGQPDAGTLDADGRLRDRVQLGGLRKAFVVDQVPEDLEVFDVHGERSWITKSNGKSLQV